jgi:hypothetical protein
MAEQPDPPPRIHTPKKEPIKAYEAFVIYWQLGETRTIGKVAEKLQRSSENVRRFKNTWAWDERIDAYGAEIKAIFRQAMEKKAEEAADTILSARLEIIQLQLNVARRMAQKALEIATLPIVERTILKDGLTTIVKPINCRMSDAPRLSYMANVVLRQLEEGNTPRQGKGGHKGDGSQPGGLEPPMLEVWLDNGDGTVGDLSTIGPPDTLDEENPYYGDGSDDPPLEPPDGTAPP